MASEFESTFAVSQDHDLKVDVFFETGGDEQKMLQLQDDISDQNGLSRVYQFMMDVLRFGSDVAQVMFDIYVLKKQDLHVPNFAAFCVFHI